MEIEVDTVPFLGPYQKPCLPATPTTQKGKERRASTEISPLTQGQPPNSAAPGALFLSLNGRVTAAEEERNSHFVTPNHCFLGHSDKGCHN